MKKWRDPELEAIRNSVPSPPPTDSDELIRKTRAIHVSFLFGSEGKKLHDELCLTLSSTKPTPIYSGWEDFGHHLGIHPDCISYLGRGLLPQDPTYYIFRVHALNEHANIGNVIEALRKIKRFDVIQRNRGLFIELADEVHRKYRTSEESGYLSLSEGTVESSNGYSEDDIRQNIIKSPYNLITLPNILRVPSVGVNERCTATDIQVHHMKKEIQLVRAAPNIIKKRETETKPKCGITVMLTFASDGGVAAEAVARVMREKRENLPRIGVLMLQEQQHVLFQDDQLFVSNAFEEVDYIIPIITRGYLKGITGIENEDAPWVDEKYVRYIYTLLTTNFLRNRCLNKKCRCIIPDEFLRSALRHRLVKNEPLFKVWKRLSETEDLSRMLLGKWNQV